ncbi:CPBP family intramembrane glutamic endopeptidase [Sphingomonas sp. S2-65]|uniref:CPBP family intramembrane glutamic endopeptidase n=1 Tax=Sphingomonas sp. S2-65 TaxID=2903960 RepID=UPI001F21B903|nr:CPBP family intramembrane glutamic endopeptidase [Sphingomonas sp. S2-65]UYY57738.1 CPBP family intramembrane metalloprotease [Sphingomonas sp. S2-65]
MVLTLIWIAVMLVGGARWVRRDVAAYARFQTLSDTMERQHFYRRWLVESFVVFVGASVISLWLAHALWPFDGFPSAFAPANRLLNQESQDTGDHWMLMALGLTAGIAVSVAVQWRRLKNVLTPKGSPDAALIPRNRREGMLALLLSLNAGFGEELFFRLALPMLLLQVTDSLAVALAVSVLSFGLAHAHYGWKGVLATTAAGAMLTFYYLHHGSLLRVMIAHAVIDVIAFFVRPAIADWIVSRRAPRWAFLNS